MPTCRDVVTLALKMARAISPGEEPEASEAEDGMIVLQSLYDGWVSGGMFGRLEDVYLGTDEAAQEGKRYLLAAGVTLSPPAVPFDDGSEERPARDLALYEAVEEGGARTVHLYDRTGWVAMTGLTLNSEAPLASRGLAGLAACVAQSYAEMFGTSIGPETTRLALGFRSSLAGKHGTTRTRAEADWF